jgi:hypothetical protein
MGRRACGSTGTVRARKRVRGEWRRDCAALKYCMKILDIPQSGRCGTTVSVRTRYGQIRRPYAVPRDRRTSAQVRIRSGFGKVVTRWRGLTDEQRAAWARAAVSFRSRTRLNQSGRLSGYLLFIKINSTLVYLGEPIRLTPPERPTFDANPVGVLVATNTGGEVELKLSVPKAPAAPVLVLGTYPRSAGVTFAKHFTILGVLPQAEAGFSSITDLYVARYGVPPAGTRVFIRTRQVLNGWEDVPQQTSAIIPST